MHQEKATLQRQLKPMHVWAVAFGCIVGWGSFINPGKKFLPNSGVAGTAIAMALGALVMIIIAFSYAYMVPKYPQAGGEFTFTKMCFGKRAAYVCGWFLVAAYLTNVPMNSTAIGLIVDGLDGSADILKFGFHYQVAGFDVWLGEMLLAMGILILFGLLNIWGVKKAGIVQSILATLLAASVFTLTAAALISSKANGINMHPIWGFDKSAALAAGAGAANISDFAHTGGKGITSAILATFAIAPWAFVGFDTIPQTAEEFKFSYKKVSGIMIVAILFGCFVYTANNTVAAAALSNWPDRVLAGDWVLLVAAEELLGTGGHPADAAHLPGGELGVAADTFVAGGGVALGLNGAGSKHLFAQLGAALGGCGGVQLVKGDGVHLHAQVDAVQQRAADAAEVAVHGGGRAGAAPGGVAVPAALAWVHSADQHELAGIGNAAADPGDGDAAVLHGLAQHLQRIRAELGQLVEEQHAAVRERDLAGQGKPSG